MKTKNVNESVEISKEVVNAQGEELTRDVAAAQPAKGEEIPDSEDVQKAKRILRIALPKLRSYGLNFEKRTGNFFKAMEVDDTDKEGKVIIDEVTGKAKRTMRRLVVSLHKTDEAGNVITDEAGEPILTDEATECLDEINIKRAANTLANEIATLEKFDKTIEDLQKEIENKIAERTDFMEYADKAREMVVAFEIPDTVVTREKATEVRERLNAVEQKAKEIEAKNAALIAMLKAAGIPEDQIQATLQSVEA